MVALRGDISFRYLKQFFLVGDIKLLIFSSLHPKGSCEFLPSLAFVVHRSVICKLFTFQSSPLKLLGQFEPTLMLRMISTKILHFVLIRQKIMATTVIHVSNWPIYQRNLLKPLCQSETNIIGMMFGRSSTNTPQFIKTWLLNAIVVSNCNF